MNGQKTKGSCPTCGLTVSVPTTGCKAPWRARQTVGGCIPLKASLEASGLSEAQVAANLCAVYSYGAGQESRYPREEHRRRTI